MSSAQSATLIQAFQVPAHANQPRGGSFVGVIVTLPPMGDLILVRCKIRLPGKTGRCVSWWRDGHVPVWNRDSVAPEVELRSGTTLEDREGQEGLGDTSHNGAVRAVSNGKRQTRKLGMTRDPSGILQAKKSRTTTSLQYHPTKPSGV